MKWLLLSLLSTFLIGCGPDLDDPKELDTIIEEAMDVSKIQERGEGDQALIYAPNKQQPYTGWLKAISDSGQVRELVQIKDGKKNGLHANWLNNGQKVYEEEYKDGELHGLTTAWHENGQKGLAAEYKDDAAHGDLTAWYENGQKRSEQEWKNGKLVKAKTWLPDGSDCPDTNVEDGTGTMVTYDKDGEETSREEFKNGTQVSE